MEAEKWDGKERRRTTNGNGYLGRRRTDSDPIHPLRWRLLVIWIILMTLVAGYAIRHGRENDRKAKILAIENAARIQELKETTATLTALQKTNCGLSSFLLTARRARWDAYLRSKDSTDLRAVEGYERLVGPFVLNNSALGECRILERLKIKERPLPGENG